MISRRRFGRCLGLGRARGPWILDSGGFTELRKFGRWSLCPSAYAAEVLALSERVGRLRFAVVQDWMCEPEVLAATGLSVVVHQRRTVASWLALSELAPAVPWMPVLQGWRVGDYVRHLRAYERSGVDLFAALRVGVGSVCRRQSAAEALSIFRELSGCGLKLHGFGLKTGFFARGGAGLLSSADSMAWSVRARRSGPLPGCAHPSCANCMRFALRWGRSVRWLAASG
jgi:hypothetical protein